MFFFHPIRSKEPPILNFPMLDIAKYFYKMAAIAGPSCGEVGLKFSKQKLSNFSEFITKQLDVQWICIISILIY